MKKSMIATLVAAPLLSLSGMSFAAEPVSTEPVQLSAAQMDGVTAGFFNYADIALVYQVNASPITLVQANLGNDGRARNSAFILSGNFSSVRQ